jgi:hypothetical protein
MFQGLVANASGVSTGAGCAKFRMTSDLFGFVADIPWNGRI